MFEINKPIVFVQVKQLHLCVALTLFLNLLGFSAYMYNIT